jgi:prolyl oligopeptidase
MLYGYGGFNVSLTPAFSIANVDGKRRFMPLPLRGGGEYGKNGMMGTKMQKQNVFDDFIAAEYPLFSKIYQIFLLFVVGQMEVC